MKGYFSKKIILNYQSNTNLLFANLLFALLLKFNIKWKCMLQILKKGNAVKKSYLYDLPAWLRLPLHQQISKRAGERLLGNPWHCLVFFLNLLAQWSCAAPPAISSERSYRWVNEALRVEMPLHYPTIIHGAGGCKKIPKQTATKWKNREKRERKIP